MIFLVENGREVFMNRITKQPTRTRFQTVVSSADILVLVWMGLKKKRSYKVKLDIKSSICLFWLGLRIPKRKLILSLATGSRGVFFINGFVLMN